DRREVGAQRAHGIRDAGPHLVGQAAHGRRHTALDLVEFGLAGGEFGDASIRDRVDGLAAVGLAADEALLAELRQAGVDRARARDVGAAETIAECLHEFVAVHGPLREQAQQVEAQVAVAEDGGHCAATAWCTVTSPVTELTLNSSRLPESSPKLPL